MIRLLLPILIVLGIPILMIIGGYKNMIKQANSKYGIGCGGFIIMVLGLAIIVLLLLYLF